MAESRQILHVDMDAFFAAIEQRDHPEYKGKPLIVGADPKKGSGRGVVSTCSYEARKFGVHSAMPVSQAYRLCPHGIYVPPNGKLYTQVSKDIFEIFYQFSDLVEPLSIDEAFLDITGSIALFKSAEKLARQLKQKIVDSQEITASVGLAPNKFLAKMASDLQKPDGLVIVDAANTAAFLNPLDVSRLWGAGKRTIEKLHAYGIYKIGDLRVLPLEVLENKFGKLGEHFYRLCRGIDNRAVVPAHGVKSVSNEMTFSQDKADTKILYQTLLRLSEKVGHRLRQQDLQGRTIHLKLRYESFETLTRNHTIKGLTSSTDTIFEVVQSLFDKTYQRNRKVRLLGVGVSGFKGEQSQQLSLFDKKVESKDALDELEDLVKEKFGKSAISRAASLKTEIQKPKSESNPKNQIEKH